MRVKDIKKYLSLYKDDVEIVIKGESGIVYKIKKEMVEKMTFSDSERKICKLYIK